MNTADQLSASEFIKALRQRCGLTLNAAQARRLAWLAERHGPPALWDGNDPWPRDARLVVVVRPPSALQLETQSDRLRPDGIVVIPCGEDPGYDALKSRLAAFGTIGTAGAAGPHQFWWGSPAHGTFASSFAWTDTNAGASASPPFERLQAGPTSTAATEEDARMTSERILSVWQQSDRPVVWRHGSARPVAADAEILSTDCDFAVHKRQRWQFDASVLYFGRRSAAETLLRMWTALCWYMPEVDDGLLLDQAWCLVTSQTCLDTLWLPAAQGAARDGRRSLRDGGNGNGADGDDFSSDPRFMARLKTARSAERTGFPELVMSSPAVTDRDPHALVVIRDAAGGTSSGFAALIERLAQAYADDPAGFRQVEIAICACKDDIEAALQGSPVERTLVINAAHHPVSDTFSRLAKADDPIVLALRAAVLDLGEYRAFRRARPTTKIGSA